MKKIFTLIAVFTAFTLTTVYAQSKIGIRAGINSASWKGDAASSLNDLVSITKGYVNTRGRTGFHAGGYANIPLSASISVEPGLFYSQKGYALKGDIEIEKLDFLGANANLTVQSHYIDLPVLLTISPVKGLELFGGPQLSYLVKQNMNINAGVFGVSLINRNIDITDQFNSIDAAVVGGVGYKFDNGFSIRGSYDHGLSRLDKNQNFKSYNRVFKVGIGFEF